MNEEAKNLHLERENSDNGLEDSSIGSREFSRKRSTGSGKEQREKHGFMTEKRTSLQKLGMTGRPLGPSKMRR